MGTSAGVGERATICKEGCAMSCLAMALAGYGIVLPSSMPSLPSVPTPGTLNAYLVANGGYKCAGGDCNNLVLDATNAASGGRVRLVGEWGGPCCGGSAAKPSLAWMRQQLSNGPPRSTAPSPPLLDPYKPEDRHVVLIAHVRNGTHFVLLTEAAPDDANASRLFDVHDPFFPATQYSYDDMSDILIYSVLKTPSLPSPPSPPSQSSVRVPYPYPLWKQSDYRWGHDLIDTETVGAVGCLMSSTAMALGGHGIGVPAGLALPTGLADPTASSALAAPAAASVEVATPGSLNRWLRANGGYVQNDLEEAAVPGVDPSHVAWNVSYGMHTTNDLTRVRTS
jgi:hypothetical protein